MSRRRNRRLSDSYTTPRNDRLSRPIPTRRKIVPARPSVPRYKPRPKIKTTPRKDKAYVQPSRLVRGYAVSNIKKRRKELARIIPKLSIALSNQKQYSKKLCIEAAKQIGRNRFQQMRNRLRGGFGKTMKLTRYTQEERNNRLREKC